MAEKSTTDTIKNAVEILATTKLGLSMIRSGDPRQRIPGLHNLAVFGRAVTNVLQNLRSSEPSFEAWYAPYVEQMRADELLRYFYELRTEILKMGSNRTTVSAEVHSFTPFDIAKFGPAPTGASHFFIGDTLGGSGWEVPQTDGSVERYYVGLPESIGTVEMQLADAPKVHLGETLDSSRVEDLALKYYSYLEQMVNEARIRFR